MRISIDERDVTSILDLELYIKERDYCLNCQEYDIFLKLSSKFLILETIYHKDESSDLHKIAILFSYYSKTFWCWTYVNFHDFRAPRRRNILRHSEELLFLEDYYFYFKERNFLINTQEFLQIKFDPYNWSLVEREWRNLSSDEINKIPISNQAAAIYTMGFCKNDEITRISTYVSKYNPYSLERRRN